VAHFKFQKRKRRRSTGTTSCNGNGTHTISSNPEQMKMHGNEEGDDAYSCNETMSVSIDHVDSKHDGVGGSDDNSGDTLRNIDTDIDKSHGEYECEYEYDDHLAVIALGVGTKFLSEEKIQLDAQYAGSKISINDDDDDGDGDCDGTSRDGEADSDIPRLSSYGQRIRDSHAEVLARRSFRRSLTSEITFMRSRNLPLKDTHGIHEDMHEDTHHEGEDPDDSRTRIDVNGNGFGILRQIKKVKSMNKNGQSQVSYTYALKHGVTLHMYTSSTPCGNSSLKKFAKMAKEKFNPNIPPHQWPTHPHPSFHLNSLHLGSCALLVKKKGGSRKDIAIRDDGGTSNHTITSSETNNNPNETGNHHREIDDSHIRKKQKKWPANISDDWCPPGTTIPHFGQGSIHSCSDKICRWNCMGLQGSLLSSLMETPLYMDTLTVGRKFTSCICLRAVCCRANDFCYQCIGNEETDKDGTDDVKDMGILYKLNHPSIMGTGVYLDDSGTIDMSGPKTVGQDVRFLSNLCWVWWSDPTIDDSNADESRIAECIDGDEGFVHCYDERKEDIPKADDRMGNDYSSISTYALLNSFLELTGDQMSKCVNKGDSFDSDGRKGRDSILSFTLPELRDLKRRVSSQHETAKDHLLQRHKIFYQWNRRCP